LELLPPDLIFLGTKFDFSCGQTPDLAEGAYSTLPDLLAKVQESHYTREGEERKVKSKGEKGKKRNSGRVKRGR